MYPNVSQSALLIAVLAYHNAPLFSAGSAQEKVRSDSTSSLNISDLSLKRLLKDLQRCDVSLSRYQDMLIEVCKLESVCWYDFKLISSSDILML